MTAAPQLLVLTDRTGTGGPSLADTVAAALDAALAPPSEVVREIAPEERAFAHNFLPEQVAVLFREKDLAATERRRLADSVRAITRERGVRFLMASTPLGDCDGVHLASTDPGPAHVAGRAVGRLVGRSCHSIDDVRRAEAEGCDYVTISPVFETSSKPGYGPTLGLAGLRAVCRAAGLPVVALGGVHGSTVDACFGAGAHGVAIMGAAMRSPASFLRAEAPA